jgi:hypothetical protein
MGSRTKHRESERSIMPYITSDNKKPIDPEIGTLVRKFLIESEIITRKNGKYFFFRLLTIFYDELRETLAIRTTGKKARYQHYNELEGALGCAGKELFRRWSELLPLKVRILNWNHADEQADRYVSKENKEFLRFLSTLIIERFAITSCESEDRLPQAMAQTVGEINYTISEFANVFGNDKRATHQELLDMVIAVSYFLHEKYCGPYENEAINKNGDTAGFKKFFELFIPESQKKV